MQGFFQGYKWAIAGLRQNVSSKYTFSSGKVRSQHSPVILMAACSSSRDNFSPGLPVALVSTVCTRSPKRYPIFGYLFSWKFGAVEKKSEAVPCALFACYFRKILHIVGSWIPELLGKR